MICSYFKEFFHKVLIGVHFLPREAAELSMQREQNVGWHFGGRAEITVMLQVEPKCPMVARD